MTGMVLRDEAGPSPSARDDTGWDHDHPQPVSRLDHLRGKLICRDGGLEPALRWLIRATQTREASAAELRPSRKRPLHFFQRIRIIEGGQVARITPLRKREQRAAQEFAGAGLRQRADDVDAGGTGDGAEAVFDLFAHAVSGGDAGVAFGRGLAQGGEDDGHLPFQFVGDADDRGFGDDRAVDTASSISRVPRRWPATLMTSSVRPRMKV